jgi:hypothetical protein
MIHCLLNYLDGQDIKDLVDIANKHLSPQLGEAAMGTFAQQLIQQGMQRGMQKGEYTMLLRQLRCKFHTISKEILQCLQDADEDTLLQWAERLINAKSIEEVFSN